MKKCLLVGFIVAFCFSIAACSAINENTPAASEAPAQTESDSQPILMPTPEQEDFSQSEEMTSLDSFATEAELNPKQIYYEYLFNNFEIIEYESIQGQWQLWGHNTNTEVRLTKQVYINQIDGFDYPVMVLAEFTLEEDGITLNESNGLLNAYLIKDGEIKSDLDRAEFDAIFRPASDGPGWSTRYEDEILDSVMCNGETLFFHDFSGDVMSDKSMDIVLDWLSEI